MCLCVCLYNMFVIYSSSTTFAHRDLFVFFGEAHYPTQRPLDQLHRVSRADAVHLRFFYACKIVGVMGTMGVIGVRTGIWDVVGAAAPRAVQQPRLLIQTTSHTKTKMAHEACFMCAEFTGIHTQACLHENTV